AADRVLEIAGEEEIQGAVFDRGVRGIELGAGAEIHDSLRIVSAVRLDRLGGHQRVRGIELPIHRDRAGRGRQPERGRDERRGEGGKRTTGSHGPALLPGGVLPEHASAVLRARPRRWGKCGRGGRYAERPAPRAEVSKNRRPDRKSTRLNSSHL